jgi:hypothetical protein
VSPFLSERLDSNQRPPEPHFPGQECFQPPNVTNASLLVTYRFHSSHSLRRSQPKINESPTFSRLFRAQACPLGGVRHRWTCHEHACDTRDVRSGTKQMARVELARACDTSVDVNLRSLLYDGNLRRSGTPTRARLPLACPQTQRPLGSRKPSRPRSASEIRPGDSVVQRCPLEAEDPAGCIRSNERR